CIMTTKGYAEAAALAASKGWKRVAELLTKATIAGGTTSASSISTLLQSFMQALRNVGAFESVAAAAMPVPTQFVGRVTIFSSTAASSIAEGAAKTLRYIGLSQKDFTPVKVIAQCVMSREFIGALADEGLRVLGSDLKSAVAVACDSALLS